MKIKGSIDSALAVADLFNHERSKIYGTPLAEASLDGDLVSRPDETENTYSEGSPAPLTVDIKSKL